MSLESALALAVICFIPMAIPGPGVLALVGHTLAKGYRASFSMMLGMLAGDLIFIALTIGGLAVLAKSFETTFLIIRLAAAAYLVVLGVKAWQAGPLDLRDADQQAPKRRRGFISGLLLTLSNPKVIAFYAGILPGFMDLGALQPLDALLAVGIVLGVLVCVLVFYMLAASRARTLLKGERTLKLMNRSSGTVMIGAGITIAVKG